MIVWDEENAAHLLSRAGFGPSPREVRSWVLRGHAGSVGRLVSQRGSPAMGPAVSGNDRESLQRLRVWWLKRMATQNTGRLQEKMTLFWHDHFSTQYAVVKNVRQMALQNRIFRQHGLGRLHNLVHQVTRDAAMLQFLDNNKNRRGNINENFGRELMELFVLGVCDLTSSRAPNYTQHDVEALSRAVTGFQINDHDSGFFEPSRFDDDTKHLFSGTPNAVSGNFGIETVSGHPLPAGQNVIDALLAHRDSAGALTVPRFLANKLWAFFAYPDPPLELIDELTSRFISSGFVISDLLRAIFMHDEFYSETAKTSHVRTPVDLAVAALRAYEVRTLYSSVPGHLADMGMDLFDPPTVAGWAPGMAWLSSGLLLARFAFGQHVAWDRNPLELLLLTENLVPTGASSAAEVVDEILRRLCVMNSIPAASRTALIDSFEGEADFESLDVLERKVRGVAALALQLPETQLV